MPLNQLIFECAPMFWTTLIHPLIFLDTPKEIISGAFTLIFAISLLLGLILAIISMIFLCREDILLYNHSNGIFHQGSEYSKLFLLAMEIGNNFFVSIVMGIFIGFVVFLVLATISIFGYLILLPLILIGSIVLTAFLSKHYRNILWFFKIKSRY